MTTTICVPHVFFFIHLEKTTANEKHQNQEPYLLLLLYLNTYFLPVSSYITATVPDFTSAENHGDQRCDNMKYHFSLIFLHTLHSNSAIPRDQSAPHERNYCDYKLPGSIHLQKTLVSTTTKFHNTKSRKVSLPAFYHHIHTLTGKEINRHQ